LAFPWNRRLIRGFLDFDGQIEDEDHGGATKSVRSEKVGYARASRSRRRDADRRLHVVSIA
jgi:hypothetical protein